MSHKRYRSEWLLVLSVLCCLSILPLSTISVAAPLPPMPAASSSPVVVLPIEPTRVEDDVLTAYRRRLAHVRRQIPSITVAAEAVAQRWVERKGGILIQVPMLGDSAGFASEMTFRAGGLDNVSLPYGPDRLSAAGDVIVYAPRSWETGIGYLKAPLTENRESGLLNVVFASRAGAPADLPIDFLIDNGAANGGKSEAALNQIVNITNAWLWSCELTSALTRRAYRPGILKGMTLPGSTANNKEYQTKHRALYPSNHPIVAGTLANIYLRELEKLLSDLESGPRRQQIDRAAEIAAQRLRAGKGVWAASFTHALDTEALLDLKSPMKAFHGYSNNSKGELFTQNLKKGDLLFWFGEWTVNTPDVDFIDLIRKTGADYIPSYRPIREPMEPMEGDKIFYDQRLEGALMILEQHWPYENAVVDIPFPPGKMAPVSGVYVSLMYRMLDEAIAARASTKR